MHDKRVDGAIEVYGVGEIAVAPDEAVVELSVIIEGKTASAAVSINAKTTQAVVSAVSNEPNHGVTTTGLGLTPIYEYDPDTNISKIVGFRATNGVIVQTKVGYAGQIFDIGIDAGANQSSGISFRVQDEAPLREQALRAAVERASAEARVVADAANVELAGPEQIEIDPGAGPIMLRSKALASDAPATPVITGDVTIRANVRIVFRSIAS